MKKWLYDLYILADFEAYWNTNRSYKISRFFYLWPSRMIFPIKYFFIYSYWLLIQKILSLLYINYCLKLELVVNNFLQYYGHYIAYNENKSIKVFYRVYWVSNLQFEKIFSLLYRLTYKVFFFVPSLPVYKYNQF